ncbi:hypothetical protein PUMCH_000876 [Australozyma saopauloensis]|uniref:Peptidase S8/S53 domain-containing protein n=1 Tax=Australozyma saopauloensis TaxID=291208 RepID=A0AAX4H5X2_9ASCO|nr:hypothetical protein PUMCH_000876 [[Candida] saopauloensis]
MRYLKFGLLFLSLFELGCARSDASADSLSLNTQNLQSDINTVDPVQTDRYDLAQENQSGDSNLRFSQSKFEQYIHPSLERRDPASSPQSLGLEYPHRLNGVEDAHFFGMCGNGSVIGIIGSGINANHDSIKGRVLPGYDFTTNSSLADGNTDPTGHGTFCASVAIADSNKMLGVAPQAKVRMYKVKDLNDALYILDMLRALQQALKDKVDVILVSQGLNLPFDGSDAAEQVSKVAEQVPVVLPAGDFGNKGLFGGMSGAVSDKTIIAGSYDTKAAVVYEAALIDGEFETSLPYYTSSGVQFDTNSTYEAIIVKDACSTSQVPQDGTGKFLIGYLGETCGLEKAIKLAGDRNFIGIILQSYGDYVKNLTLSSSMPQFVGATYREFSTDKPKLMLQLRKKNPEEPYNMETLLTYDSVQKPIWLSDFSSWGPTFDQRIYPHVIAPGGNIFGADQDGGYTVKSGTSYSAAYVAGMVAILLGAQINDTLTSKQVRNSVLASTYFHTSYVYVTDDFSSNCLDKNHIYESILKQGAGYADGSVLFQQLVLLSEPHIHLKDTKNRVSSHVITIQNSRDNSVYIVMDHTSAELIEAADSDGFLAKPSIPYYISDFNKTSDASPEPRNIVLFSQSHLRLGPGEKGSINVTINPPPGLDKKLLPIFSGYINISVNNDLSRMLIPYMGMEFDASEVDTWNGPVQLGTLQDGKFVPATENLGNVGDFEFPVISNPMAYGSPFVSFDLVSADYNPSESEWPPMPGQGGYIGSVPPSLNKSRTLFPFPNIPATSDKLFTLESFTNGSTIPKGDYKMMYRALKLFGDAKNFNDWTLHLTPKFTIESDLKSNPSLSLTATRTTISSLTSQSTEAKTNHSKGSASHFNVSQLLVALQILFAFGI